LSSARRDGRGNSGVRPEESQRVTMTARNPRIVSLNIGEPRHLGTKADGSPFISSIARRPVPGPLPLGLGGFERDACNWSGHHGLDMAVNVFAVEDYPYFEELGGKTLPRPAFGENLTLEGYRDEVARVGDILRVGTALLQVSQPRIPCGNVSRYLGLPRILRWMEEGRRTGFYLRVVEPGEVAAESPVEMIQQGDSPWTIAALTGLMFSKEREEGGVGEALELEALSREWKSSLVRLTRRTQPAVSKGSKLTP